MGWLVTKEPNLARWARLFIEMTTSGVSIPAQAVVARALAWTRNMSGGYSLRAAECRAKILENGKIFNHLMGDICVRTFGVPDSGSGMFAYFSVPDDLALRFADATQPGPRSSGVLLVSGLACGETYPIWHRMSMGQTNDYTEAAIKKLRGVL